MNSPLQRYGEPITCYHGDNKPQDIINQYCWLQGTYKLDQNYQGHIDDCWGKNKTNNLEDVRNSDIHGRSLPKVVWIPFPWFPCHKTYVLKL